MIDKEAWVLGRAYVPEHIVSLMSFISKGEPFLVSDYVCYHAEDWLIFVGYPLEGEHGVEEALDSALERFSPERVFLIASETPSSIACQEKNSDEYYKLELGAFRLKKGLRYRIKKAEKELEVEQGVITREHEELVSEFLTKQKPDAYLRSLFRAMPEYAKSSDTCVVLNARDKRGGLSAFSLVDLAAKNFASYLISTYSRKHYVPGASDLLFHEMVRLATENRKKYINLGLGVNPGIRRFKEKWGGIPFLKYESCSYSTVPSDALDRFRAWGV